MTSRSTCNVNTPVYNPRTLKLFLRHDPLGIDRYESYNFDLEVFDTYDEESQFQLVVNDKVKKTGSTYNNFYGAGTSMSDPVKEAMVAMVDFGITSDRIKFQVVTTITEQWVFRSTEKPFYRGSLKMYQVPSNWWLQGTTRYDEQTQYETTQTVVWENGKWTDEARVIEDLLVSRHAADVMGLERDGPLRAVNLFTQVE
jgi:hypothetical protein